MTVLGQILQDALFAAIAAIGFAAISRPPLRAYLYCAIIAALGHSVRFFLMNAQYGPGMHILAATAVAAFVVGLLAVFLSPAARVPAETCLFPALLPMIPGIYAYKTFGALALCAFGNGEETFNHYFYLFASNGMTCLAILLVMVVGATMPIFMFEKISFQATRHRKFL